MRLLFIYMLAFATVILPAFQRLGVLPSIRPEDLLIVPGLLVLILARGVPFRDRLFGLGLRKLTIPYVFLLVYFMFVTVVVASLVDPQAILFRLVNALGKFRPLVLLVVMSAALSKRRDAQRLAGMMIVLGLLEVVIMYFQRYNTLGVNNWLTPLYLGSAIEKYAGLVASGARVVGTVGNPNDVGTVLSLVGTLAMARLIFGTTALSRLLSIAAVVTMLFGCVWLAKTRQGTAGLLAGIAFLLVISMRLRGRRGWGTIGVIVMLLILVVGIYYVQADRIVAERFGIFTGQRGISDVHSLTARFRNWPRILSEDGGWLFFGRGKNLEKTWDSGYLNTLRAMGVPGLTAMILLFLLPSIAAWRHLRALGTRHTDAWLLAGTVATGGVLLLTSIVNSTWESPLVMGIIVLMYAPTLAVMRLEIQESWQERWVQEQEESWQLGEPQGYGAESWT